MILPGLFIIGCILSFAMGTSMGTVAALTPIAATRTQDVSMKAKFKANILMVLPAVVINLILLSIQHAPALNLSASYNYNVVNVIPYVLVIVLSLVGMNVMSVMSLGVVSGMLIRISC